MSIIIKKAWIKLKKALFCTPLGLALFRLLYKDKQQFTCPICFYNGPFIDINPETGFRKHASCPKCGSFERHRLQYLVVEEIAKMNDFSNMSILHFAPEPFFQELFRRKFGSYTSADLNMTNVDYQIDLLNIPFDNESFDFVFESHVLEHIKDDGKALSEISRILKQNGTAVLPVPIVADETIEYPEPNLYEAVHVRAPGPDYYKKYSLYFKKIEKFNSKTFPDIYQLFIYEDRSKWRKTMPLRPTVEGEKHIDIVPICYK